jgi:hypothetical protein
MTDIENMTAVPHIPDTQAADRELLDTLTPWIGDLPSSTVTAHTFDLVRKVDLGDGETAAAVRLEIRRIPGHDPQVVAEILTQTKRARGWTWRLTTPALVAHLAPRTLYAR